MSLARSDGLLWLGITFLMGLTLRIRVSPLLTRHSLLITRNLVVSLLGFLLIMFPWYARNLSVYGSLLAPGGSRALWLDNYDQTFMYPASQLTMQSFLALGWKEIISDRLWALTQFESIEEELTDEEEQQ
jgi:hypothetical protein